MHATLPCTASWRLYFQETAPLKTCPPAFQSNLIIKSLTLLWPTRYITSNILFSSGMFFRISMYTTYMYVLQLVGSFLSESSKYINQSIYNSRILYTQLMPRTFCLQWMFIYMTWCICDFNFSKLYAKEVK